MERIIPEVWLRGKCSTLSFDGILKEVRPIDKKTLFGKIGAVVPQTAQKMERCAPERCCLTPPGHECGRGQDSILFVKIGYDEIGMGSYG